MQATTGPPVLRGRRAPGRRQRATAQNARTAGAEPPGRAGLAPWRSCRAGMTDLNLRRHHRGRSGCSPEACRCI